MREKWIVWCELNAEQDALAALLGDECVTIYGSLDAEEKERRERQWRTTDIPVMVTKPLIFGHGLNWQFCRRMVFVGVTHSFEQMYQAIRRCWRFGQTRAVEVHVVLSEQETAVLDNLQRKEADAERLTAEMVAHMAPVTRASLGQTSRTETRYEPQEAMRVPTWLRTEEAA